MWLCLWWSTKYIKKKKHRNQGYEKREWKKCVFRVVEGGRMSDFPSVCLFVTCCQFLVTLMYFLIMEDLIRLFFYWWSQMVLTQCDSRCSALNAKVDEISNKRGQTAGVTMNTHKCSHFCSECQSGWKLARVNGRSNYGNVIPVQCSECQSGEKFKTSAGKRWS